MRFTHDARPYAYDVAHFLSSPYGMEGTRSRMMLAPGRKVVYWQAAACPACSVGIAHLPFTA